METKAGSVNRRRHDLQTQLNRARIRTGSRFRISAWMSSGSDADEYDVVVSIAGSFSECE